MLLLQKCQKEASDSFKKKSQGSFQSEALNKINTILQNVLVYLCLRCQKKKKSIEKFHSASQTSKH